MVCAQPGAAADPGLPPAGLAYPMLDHGQPVPGGVRQHGARRRGPHAVAAAPQRRADDLLQPPDLLAEGRLGDEQRLRGA
jgi:hypothetical protein